MYLGASLGSGYRVVQTKAENSTTKKRVPDFYLQLLVLSVWCQIKLSKRVLKVWP